MMTKLIAAIAVLLGCLGLAACGGDDSGGLEGGGGDVEVETAQGGDPSGELTISNWPLYIDKQTVSNFEEGH
jgi:ABC-type glycerol-3-phosphate transport system substrate-binding protein